MLWTTLNMNFTIGIQKGSIPLYLSLTAYGVNMEPVNLTLS